MLGYCSIIPSSTNRMTGHDQSAVFPGVALKVRRQLLRVRKNKALQHCDGLLLDSSIGKCGEELAPDIV